MRLAALFVLAVSPVSSFSYVTGPAVRPDLRVTRTLTGARLRVSGVPARSMRLFVVGGAGLRVFHDERLDRQRDGTFAVDLALGASGLYMAFVEFVSADGRPQMSQQAFTIGSALAARPSQPADDAHESEGIGAAMDASQVKAGVETTLAFDFTGAAPGAAAEAFIVSADLTEAQHLAAGDTSRGTHVVFSPIFPRSGSYKAWLIVPLGQGEATIPFLIDVN